MLTTIKKYLPAPFKRALLPVKQKTVDNWYKTWLFYKMCKKHQHLLAQIKDKKCIRVVFLAIHKSVWKVDPVFKKMLAHQHFDPVVLICPFTASSEERMWNEMHQALEYFKAKEYPVVSSFNHDKGEWLKLEELNPDIVFFTNPHNLTRKEYYEDAYLNYLSCYIPYHHEVVSYGSNIDQYNQNFHNAMWKIFASHKASYELFLNYSVSKGMNVIVTGYPAMETILEKMEKNTYNYVWKSKDSRIKIIWAPHHTIDMPELPFSNFLEYSDNFRRLAEEYKSRIVWAFKPHPLLREKLYKHISWGKKRTDEYYEFWNSNEYTQLEEGEYEDLFCSSNALIHDSGSFLAEYLYLKKPVAYMMAKKNNQNYFTDFGLKALSSCVVINDFIGVVNFVDNLILDKYHIINKHKEFIQEEISIYFHDSCPSSVILDTLNKTLNP